ncbi:MAG TPA: 2-polyprenylphenol 6-hydroxylase, partial [Alphaproteobacteria bacterium]|nr:2-polyprenylphenol 6-hydroxylase [Alphaproteobacteria bacterium]
MEDIMFSSINNINRLFKIFRTLAEYDALFFAENLRSFPTITYIAKLVSPKRSNQIMNLRKGQRLALALQNLGPTFIKLGQALSVRADIIGEEIAKDLSALQDSLPPFSTRVAKDMIESELGRKITDMFDDFEERPVAAASIAQVHFAKLKETGEEVAIKILRPNIEKKFRQDIELLEWMARKVQDNLPKLRRLKPVEMVETFAVTSRNEMDFLLEAAAASELKDNFKDDNEIKVPKIYWHYTTNKILVLEKFKGIRVNDIEALQAAGHNINEILRKSANIFMKQALRDGFFHADMHPGNVLVDEVGRIAVFDFGIMGRIDRKTRLFLAQMLLGFLNRDYEKVAELHFEMEIVPPTQDKKLFEQACRSIGEPIMDLPQNQISIGRLLGQLFKIANNFEMQLLPQLFLLQKTMAMAEGIGRTLNPNLNIWELSRGLIEDWGKENFSVKARTKDRI